MAKCECTECGCKGKVEGKSTEAKKEICDDPDCPGTLKILDE